MSAFRSTHVTPRSLARWTRRRERFSSGDLVGGATGARMCGSSDGVVIAGIVDPVTGRKPSRFTRRRLERDPEFRAMFKQTAKAERQKAEARAVTKDAKKRLKEAAEG